jgi:hypothetical protein
VNLTLYVFSSSPSYSSSSVFVYGASNGVVQDIAVNSTGVNGFNEAYIVGAFDSVTQTSQDAYCSVGKWDGFRMTKVLFRNEA